MKWVKNRLRINTLFISEQTNLNENGRNVLSPGCDDELLDTPRNVHEPAGRRNAFFVIVVERGDVAAVHPPVLVKCLRRLFGVVHVPVFHKGENRKRSNNTSSSSSSSSLVMWVMTMILKQFSLFLTDCFLKLLFATSQNEHSGGGEGS